MKKIFSFFVVALLSLSSFAINFNEPTETWTVGNTAALDAYKWNSVTVNGYAVINNDWYVLCVYDLYKAGPSKQKWINYTGSGSTSKSWDANGIFQGISYYHNDGKAATGNTSRVYSYKVTNMSAVSLYGNSSDSSRYLCLAVYEGETLVAADSATNAVDAILTLEGLDKAKTYTVVAYGNTASNSNLYEIAFSISGNEPELDPKALAPKFSVAAGEYHEPFKVGLSSSKADKIYYSMDNTNYTEYTDSIEISDYDITFTISAFSTLADAKNSDTVVAEYLLTHFIPRPVFNARKTIDLTGITKDDIQILSGTNATIGEYTMDGKPCPSVNYQNIKTADQKDSVMIIGFAGRDGLTLRYKNSSAKSNALKIPAQYVQADSKNFELYVDDVKGGDTVVFVVTAKGSAPKFDHEYSTACYLDPYQPDDDTDPCFTDGDVYTKSDARVDNDYTGWTNLVYVVQEGHTKIRLKENANGFRIAKIQIGAYRGEAPQGIENNAVNGKAVKFFRDGQLIIRKNGVEFNAIGTKL